VLKVAHALSQLGGAYQRLVEGAELAERVKALEEVARVAQASW
jgi:hypothetical protein